MPDEAPPTLQTVENGDIPAPLSNLMRFVGIQVKKLQAEVTGNSDEKSKKLHAEVKQRLQDILLDFGFGENLAERIGSEFGGEVTLLSGEAIPQIETSIQLAYEKCLGGSPENGESKSVVLKKVNSRSDLRLVFNSLRTSPDFGDLREKRIWMLPVLELKNTLEKTFCRNGFHWHKMILMALRFCEEEKTLSSYDISADGLRHFLCDYVFCVPREEFVGKPHTGRRKKYKTRQDEKRNPPISEDETPKTRKPRAKQNDFPKHPPDISQHIHLLTPRELEIFRLFYGYVPDKKAYIIGFRKDLHQIRAILGNLTYASVYIPFRRCLDKLSVKPEVLLGEKPVPRKRGRKPKDPGIVAPEVLPAGLDVSPSENTPTEKPVTPLPKGPKVSLAGVEIPDELPDVSQVGVLSRAMREIFLLYYGYTAGDMTNPASYDVSKRMTRDEIAEQRDMNKYSVYQTLQKAILRLRPPAVGEIQTIEPLSEEPPVTVDGDVQVVLETVSEPAPVKPSTPLPEKPTHPDIPPTIGSYRELVGWLQEEGQVSLVRALKNQLIHAQGKKGAGLPSLGVRIFGGFTFGSLEARVLQLVHFFDSKKDFAPFIGELKAHKSAEKPPQPKKRSIPTFTPRPVAPPPPVKAAEEKQPEPAKPIPPVESVVQQPINTDIPAENYDYEKDLEHLRNRDDWVALLREANNLNDSVRDDMGITSFFRQNNPDILAFLQSMRRAQPAVKYKKILHDVFNPNPLIFVKKHTQIVAQLRVFLGEHRKGDYVKFTEGVAAISQNEPLLEKICDIQVQYGARSIMEVIALICDEKWSDEDEKTYEPCSLKEVFKKTPGVMAHIMKVLSKGPHISYRELEKLLSEYKVKVPLGSIMWTAYQTASLTEVTLGEILGALIRTDTGYQKGYEESTRHLRSRLQRIVED